MCILLERISADRQSIQIHAQKILNSHYQILLKVSILANKAVLVRSNFEFVDLEFILCTCYVV